MAYISPSISASGITFPQWQAMGASGHVEALITAQVTNGAPLTAPTLSATGVSTTGGSLAAGGYFVKVTEGEGTGETTASPESAVMTVAAGNIPKVTFPALTTGNVYYNVYATPANGASGTEVLYATGVTTNTFAMAAAAPSNSFAQPPPTVNTTGMSWVDANGNTINTPLAMIRSVKDGNLEDIYRYLRTVIDNFNRGDPMPGNAIVMKIRHVHTVLAILAQMCTECGTLADANAGTIKTAQNGIGNTKQIRTWP